MTGQFGRRQMCVGWKMSEDEAFESQGFGRFWKFGDPFCLWPWWRREGKLLSCLRMRRQTWPTDGVCRVCSLLAATLCHFKPWSRPPTKLKLCVQGHIKDIRKVGDDQHIWMTSFWDPNGGRFTCKKEGKLRPRLVCGVKTWRIPSAELKFGQNVHVIGLNERGKCH